MKVLMLGTKSEGGMGSVIDSYLSSDLAEEFSIRFIITHKYGNIFRLMYHFIIALIRAQIYIFNPSYRILHMHVSKEGSLIRKLFFVLEGKLFRKKVIFHTHGGEFFSKYEGYPAGIKRLIRLLFDSVDAIIVLSDRRKDEYSAITKRKKIHVIPNFLGLRQDDVKNINTDRLTFFYLGMLNRQKGIDDIIEATSRLKDRKFKVILAGIGEIDRYKEMIHRKGLDGMFDFTGWIEGEKKLKVLQEGDICILPSYFEDLPMTIMESLAFGRPIITTDVGGIFEMVRHGENGFMCTPGDVKKITEYMQIFLDNPQKIKEMGNASRGLFEQKYASEKIQKQVGDLYLSLIASRGQIHHSSEVKINK